MPTTATATPTAVTKSAKPAAPKAKKEKKAAPKAKKPAAPKAKATKKAAASTNGEYGVSRSKDIGWNETKVKVLEALKSAGATSQLKAVSVTKVVEVANDEKITGVQVRHYVYHAQASDITGVVKLEGQRGYSLFLKKPKMNFKNALQDALKAKAKK